LFGEDLKEKLNWLLLFILFIIIIIVVLAVHQYHRHIGKLQRPKTRYRKEEYPSVQQQEYQPPTG
jgi:hypothetical protein